MYNFTEVDGSVDDGLDDGLDVVYYCDERYDFDSISGFIFIAIFVFSLTGNILILCALVIYESPKNVTNLFILNLISSDLIFAATLPFWAVYHLHHWVFGDFACKFMTAAYFAGLYSSIILLTAMTVDRFTTVVLHNWPSKPVRRWRWASAACLAAWAISLAASVSDAYKVQVETQWNNFSTCEDPSVGSDVSLGYYLQVALLFFLPFVVIVFCYSAILRTVLKASHRTRYRTVVVVFCIVAAFFVCWGPYNLLIFIQSLYEPVGCYADKSLYVAYSVCRILAFSHCCMNPPLYMLSQELRGHLLKLLRCKNARRNNRERPTGQSTCVVQNVAFIAQSSAVLWEQPSI